jgi:hypothetical protein
MKKLSLVVLMAIALSAVVTGCNNADESKTTPPATTTNATPAAPATNAP